MNKTQTQIVESLKRNGVFEIEGTRHIEQATKLSEHGIVKILGNGYRGIWCALPSTISDLTPDEVKAGIYIIEKNHPEWGEWFVSECSTGFCKRGQSGSTIFFEQEARFWYKVTRN